MEALFLFHRGLGSDDETATVAERTEKLLFYTSSCGDDLEEQLERLSLCEAFIDLCRGFRADAPCESVFLDDHQYSLLECEPDTWLVVCCKSRLLRSSGSDAALLASLSSYASYSNVPSAVSKKSPLQKKLPLFRSSVARADRGWPGGGDKARPDADKKLYKTGGPKTAHESEQVRILESADPNTRVLRAVLERLYACFRLFHGSLAAMLFEGRGGSEDKSTVPGAIKHYRKQLRKSRLLQELVDEGDLVPDEAQAALLAARAANEDALASQLAASTADRARERLCALVPFFLSQVDFLSLHPVYAARALPFLSVDKSTFLSTQMFMTRLADRFPQVRAAALLYGGQLLWSSIELDELRALAAFLEVFVGGQVGWEAIGPPERAPGFLEIGTAVRPSTGAADGADAYFPAVLGARGGKGGRLAVFAFDRALLAVETAALGGNEWTKSHLLEFCGQFETYASAELARLAEQISTSLGGAAPGAPGQGLAPAPAAQGGASGLFSAYVSGGAAAADAGTPSGFTHQGGAGAAGHGVGLGASIGGGAGVGGGAGSGAGSGAGIGSSITNSSGGGGASSGGGNYNLAAADSTERFLYLNESNAVVKISEAWLAGLSAPAAPKESDARALSWYPTNAQLGVIFAPNLVAAINGVRHEFEAAEDESMTITEYVRPDPALHLPACWLAAVKSEERQVYLVVDAKHTFEYVAQRLRVLKDTSFRSILLV
jgi:hypothetical protein